MVLYSRNNPDFKKDSIGQYIRSVVVHGMAQALNQYLDGVAALFRHKCTRSHQVEIYVDSILCLALQCWARVVSRTDNVVIGDEKHVFQANAGVLDRLKKAYNEFEVLASNSEALKYTRPVTWGLYVGAWYEQMHAYGEIHVHAEEQWFNKRLAAHASRIGLYCWAEARAILVCYIHNDHLPFDGSLWFDRLIARAQMATPQL